MNSNYSHWENFNSEANGENTSQPKGECGGEEGGEGCGGDGGVVRSMI